VYTHTYIPIPTKNNIEKKECVQLQIRKKEKFK
jgi:hypothetical protein